MSNEILKVQNVSKTFQKVRNNQSSGIGWSSMIEQLFRAKQQNQIPQVIHALKDVSFILNKGDSLGIIGLNGSGKSTLLQIIAGTMKPSSGKVIKKGRVAALLELGSGFNPQFTGRENIFLNAALLGLSREESTEKLEQIIDFADIGEFIDQPVSTYSTGMSLRLAFAVIANIDADILIIDEALSVGDARFQIKCYSFLEKFKSKGCSIILVSHDLNAITRLCGKSILLNEGNLKQYNDTLNIVNEYSKLIAVYEDNNTNISNLINNNSKTISYGGKLGFIEKVAINNNNYSVIEAGCEFEISFVIKSNSVIKDPIYALRIRNQQGIEMYVTNTRFQNIKTQTLQKGSVATIKFKQRANLGKGKYFVSIGFTNYKNGTLQVIHRLREILTFEVISKTESIGLVNCFSEIEINYE